MGESSVGSGLASRLNRVLRGWQPPELLVLAGGSLAVAGSLGAHTVDLALGAGVPGLACALLGWRMRHLDGHGRLRGFYACSVAVMGLTTAGQAYLRMAIGSSGVGSSAWLWPLAAAGCLTLAGAGGRLFVARPGGRSAT